MPGLSPRSSAPSLASVQRLMAQTVSRPLTHDDAMQSDSLAAAEEIIKPNDRLSAFERLQIYNQQYWWRLLGNLADDFPGVRAVLGERKFDAVCKAYIERHGSSSWNLRDLGIHLPAFLRERPELTAPRSSLALEMAEVEWARVVAFDGPEKPPIDPEKIARTSPDRLRLGLQPYLTLLELTYPIDDLLRTMKESNIETVSMSNAASAGSSRRTERLAARPSRARIHLAVHRVEFSVYYKRLEPAAYRLLCALRAGSVLDAACESAFRESTEPPEESAAKIQTWFATWMRFGWLCAPGTAPRAARLLP